MPLKILTDCTEAELGLKAASLVFLAQHGVRVPDAWMWIRPRRKEDIQESVSMGTGTIILRGSEPLGSNPQEISGAYPSQICTLNELLGDALNSWLEVEHPVIVQHYVAATFGGAAHVTMSEGGGLMAHLSWSSDVKAIMEGSDSGTDVWLGDLPEFQGNGAPVLITRTAHVPEFFVGSSFVSEFLYQMRSVARVSGVPFEVEWIVDKNESVIFLQLIRLIETEEAFESPWIHPDASLYPLEK